MSVQSTAPDKEVNLKWLFSPMNILISGPTYVWKFNLRTREKNAKWVLAGVALLLQI